MEIPPCPDAAHAGSNRVRAGWYGRVGRRRQRWLCTPADGSAPHRFTEVLPRLAGTDGSCAECATSLEPWEGQPAPRLYGFSVRTVAAALARVAGGASLRETAEKVRRDIGGQPAPGPARHKNGKRRKAAVDPLRHGQLISDWVSVFAPIIWAAYAPATWPARVVLDDLGFRGGATPSNGRGVRLFSVLGAVGYAAAGARPKIARLDVVRSADSSVWAEFLSALPGRPGIVVTDGGPAILSALKSTWLSDDDPAPAPRVRRCEWHLLRGFTQALPETVRTDPHHPITRASQLALTSLDAFTRLEAAVTAHGAAPAAQRWIEINRDRVLAQAADRDNFGPHSIGAIEDVFRHLDHAIGDRAHQMTNAARATRLLMLLAADYNGWRDERAWADILRHHLQAHAGRGELQRQLTDRQWAPTLGG
jgi:hypothetical protein